MKVRNEILVEPMKQTGSDLNTRINIKVTACYSSFLGDCDLLQDETINVLFFEANSSDRKNPSSSRNMSL